MVTQQVEVALYRRVLASFFYTAPASSTGSISQGVKQPYVVNTIGLIETSLNISVKAFPNPTTDNLTLVISDYNNEKLSYQLFDVQGKLLNGTQISAEHTLISTEALCRGTYLLYILDEKNKKLQTFQIIRN